MSLNYNAVLNVALYSSPAMKNFVFKLSLNTLTMMSFGFLEKRAETVGESTESCMHSRKVFIKDTRFVYVL